MLPDLLVTALDLAFVVIVARCAGALAVRFGEPQIAGEMIGALLVGPTVLGGQIEGVVDGAVATGVVGAVFPALAVDVLTWVGALGMALYMLLVGLTIDPAPMARRAGTILVLAFSVLASIALLAVAASPALQMDGGWRGRHGTSLAFVLALGAGMAAMGVPIVARILEERGLMRSEVGGVSIAAGACVTTLALIAAGVAIRGADPAAFAELAVVVAIAAAIVAVAAPLAHSQRMALSPRVAVAVLLAIAIAAGAAGKLLIGTVLIGPLIVGIAVRSAGFSAKYLELRLGSIVRGVLLPVFLAVAALHTNLRELSMNALGPVLVLVAAVVVVKVAVTYAGARLVGFDRRDARAMGGLMQCGGVMTIAISLDVLHAGIVTPRTHAMMTLVGLVTTLLAGPLLASSGLRAAQEPGATPGLATGAAIGGGGAR